MAVTKNSVPESTHHRCNKRLERDATTTERGAQCKSGRRGEPRAVHLGTAGDFLKRHLIPSQDFFADGLCQSHPSGMVCALSNHLLARATGQDALEEEEEEDEDGAGAAKEESNVGIKSTPALQQARRDPNQVLVTCCLRSSHVP